MKLFVRSVPAVLFLTFSLIALVGCGASGGGSNNQSGPAAAKNVYVIQNTYNNTTDTEQDSVLVFSASASGSTTPTSRLALPNGFYADSLAAGPKGQIYVGGTPAGEYYGQILEYPAGSSGSATPTVTLNGSATRGTTFTIPYELAVNSAGTLFVSSNDGTLEAFASGFSASSTPTQHLTWGVSHFGDSGRYVGVDTAGDIFYMDDGNDVIDVFAAGTIGGAAPARQITGTDTTYFTGPQNIAVDGAGDVYVANYNYSNDPFNSAQMNPGTYAAIKGAHGMGSRGVSRMAARPHDDATPELTGIIEFAAGATGNATPTKRIGGATATMNLTNINEPLALAVDAIGNLYYADLNGGNGVLLEVFSPSATGNVAPAASITSTSLNNSNFAGFAID